MQPPVVLADAQSFVILEERPDSPDAVSLINELEDHLSARYRPENRHGYSVEKLITQGVVFFLLRADGKPAACGGVQLMGEEYGEVKRMYVKPEFRGNGYGKAILRHITDYARSLNIPLLRLETGIYQQEAIRLYEGMGFTRIPPFGPYTDDPMSLFFEKRTL